MRNCCWGSSADHPTPKTTDHLTSAQIAQTTSSGSSNLSKNSHFSAPSGDDEKHYRRGASMDAPSMRIFSFWELRAATRNFRPEELLGEGGFGRVYKGWLDEKGGPSRSGSKSAVAIKKLNSESTQGFEEWESEVHFLGKLSHPNLVKLLGYCWEDEELLLVYEFMQKGSLENHLFGRGSSVQSLPWNLRLKIAIGAAQALVFLHTLDEKVIYRDFKASNILLNESYTPKISDFGLARFGPTNSQSHVTTRTFGTPGYAAPEYVTTGHLYVKSDVYGFGVVLVEMMTGLRAMDLNRPPQQVNLMDWVKPYLSDRRRLKNVMDRRLRCEYPTKPAIKMAQLALTCLESDQKLRPPMKHVLETLRTIQSESLAHEKSPREHQ